ncbi:MAG TPA: GNAT family N-acetyltransferase [Microbacterium sp.]|uniref:GNAT family N-acetyltransferase n=1 Tax=Microbacterium sp. TaxID=51671 RepID=UPI002CB5515B|nr:GNAT family N-acetyltransferase [Microbacterium sp.]HWI31632.1 GNAT family N-acetyltransferase [Microbacterium sp.]
MSETELPPLDERITAPARPTVPEHPDVAVWRPAAEADIDALMVLARAMDRADHPTWVTAREEVADQFDTPYLDPATDSLVGLDADGRAVATAWASLAPGRETRVQAYAMGGVHPELRARGIGRQVLRWSAERCLQLMAATRSTLPAWLLVYADEPNTAAIRLAERRGMRIERYFAGMARPLSDPIPDIAIAENMRVVAYAPEFADAARFARNDAFRDHWGSQPSAPERWQQFVGGELFRGDLSFVIVENVDAGAPGATDALGDPVRVVAFALGSVNEEDWAAQGFSSVYIDLIGVVRDRRGQRLAPAVIAALLRAARDAGLERAILDVDTASPTGANTLYEGMGFSAVERSVALVEEF